jgi:hypothetical protein
MMSETDAMPDILERIGHLTRNPHLAKEGELDALTEQYIFGTVAPPKKKEFGAALGILTEKQMKKIKSKEVDASHFVERSEDDVGVKAGAISRKSRELLAQPSVYEEDAESDS